MRRALPDLIRRWRVYVLVRERDASLAAFGVTQIVGDLDRRSSLQRLAGLAHAVIHSSPPPDHGDDDPRTRHLIAALRCGSLPRRLVYISTSGVYGDCAGAGVAESRPARPATARGRRRRAAESQLRRYGAASGCRVAILRAPGIYAADRLPLERLQRGTPVLTAEDDVFTNHIHADDLATLAVAALRRGLPNRVYNASDASHLKMGEYFDLVADRFGLPRPPRMSREDAEKALSPVQLSFMSESRRLDNRRIGRELRVRLRYPQVAEGVDAAWRERNTCGLS